jgi:hypothetical protein
MVPRASAAASGIGDPNFEFIMSAFRNSESVNLVKTNCESFQTWGKQNFETDAHLGDEVAKVAGIKLGRNA